MNPDTVSRIEAHRRIIQFPVIKETVMITPQRPLSYRIMDWVIVGLFGVVLGSVFALLFVG